MLNYTYAYSVYPIKCALDPLTPRNEGSYRSVTVDAPEGSILNPRFPAPCSARQLTGHLLAGVIYRALVQAIPDRVIAESGSAPTLRSVYSGVDRQNQSFSQVFFASGGMGGSALQDGHNCTAFPTNTGSGSIEAFESISPLIVWKKALRTNSGGAGKFRGGLGQDVEIEVTSPHPLRLSLLSDRQKYPPEGLLGGDKGAAVEIRLQDGTSPHQKSRSVLQPRGPAHFALSAAAVVTAIQASATGRPSRPICAPATSRSSRRMTFTGSSARRMCNGDGLYPRRRRCRRDLY